MEASVESSIKESSWAGTAATAAAGGERSISIEETDEGWTETDVADTGAGSGKSTQVSACTGEGIGAAISA